MDHPTDTGSFVLELDGKPSADGSGVGEVQLVKGATFETAGRYFVAEIGEPRWEALLASLPSETAALVRAADMNEWYPEAELRQLIHAIHEQLAEGDDERFLVIARGLALAGISRFFRILINFASARFVLRKVPVIWTRLRRGPATLVSELDDDRVRIHYSDFVYCHDPVYRLLSLANCQALVFAATKQVPVATVLSHDRNSMTLEFEA